MEMKKEVAEQENICTALLTAGVVLSMACLKHFSSVSSLIEQWRSWVFLFLNVVLIAVYFTSTPPSYCEDQELKIHRRGRGKKKAKQVWSNEFNKSEQEMKSCVVKEVFERRRVCFKTEEKERACFSVKKSTKNEADEEGVRVAAKTKEDEYIEPGRLSNEELNERIEAFITMFRQHLVLDARQGRDNYRREVSQRRETETMRSKAREVSCSV